jgi:hypothetical protein
LMYSLMNKELQPRQDRSVADKEAAG